MLFVCVYFLPFLLCPAIAAVGDGRIRAPLTFFLMFFLISVRLILLASSFPILLQGRKEDEKYTNNKKKKKRTMPPGGMSRAGFRSGKKVNIYPLDLV